VHILGIRVVALGGVALEDPLSATFDESEGDIGRGVDCTLVLADPERRISRRQALVVYRDGRHFIRQVGTNLSVELDGTPLALDVEYPVVDGSQIRIGAYLLRAEIIPAGRGPSPNGAVNSKNIHAPAALTPSLDMRNVVEDMLEGLIKRHRPAAPEPSDDLLADIAPPKSAQNVQNRVDLFLGTSIGAGARPPPRPAANESLAPPTTAVEVARALYSGLGLPAPAAGGLSVRELRLIGELLRKSVEGLLALLASRAIAKRELGAGATLAQVRQNNPLKFSPDGEAALAHLLGPAQPGFIAPLDAVADAFADLQAHEVAVLAGMRSALDEILARFDPVALEQRLAPKGLWENLVPGSREAKLWTQFAARHAQILREAEGDFDALFGHAFRKAYEAQLSELARPSVDRLDEP
jgi:type VI secretion system FHA domain protein